MLPGEPVRTVTLVTLSVTGVCLPHGGTVLSAKAGKVTPGPPTGKQAEAGAVRSGPSCAGVSRRARVESWVLAG